MAKKFKNVEILWASVREPYNYLQAKQLGCHIITIPPSTIEHVGSAIKQKKMIENIIKLTKKIFIITTPNRFYPIELHTKIPLIHWFPKSTYRKILKFLGLSFYANEENLNLLSADELKKMLNNQKITYEIKFLKLFFLKSNIIIIGKKI